MLYEMYLVIKWDLKIEIICMWIWCYSTSGSLLFSSNSHMPTCFATQTLSSQHFDFSFSQVGGWIMHFFNILLHISTTSKQLDLLDWIILYYIHSFTQPITLHESDLFLFIYYHYQFGLTF